MKQKYASLQKYAKIKGIFFVFGVEEYSKSYISTQNTKDYSKVTRRFSANPCYQWLMPPCPAGRNLINLATRYALQSTP